jgi:cathepsin O
MLIDVVFSVCSYVGSEEDLLKVLATHGPVAVAVNALNWQNYVGGVIQFHCDGSPLSLNHAVQIVGYDKTAPIPHYIVRNSWGTDFGDKGYLYIAIGGNVCGNYSYNLFR